MCARPVVVKKLARESGMQQKSLMLPSQSQSLDWKGILGAVAPILVTVQYGL